MAGQDIEKLIKICAKLPSLGTRSARRVVLQLIKKRETVLQPLIEALRDVEHNIKTCEICGNFDTTSPCAVCSSEKREKNTVCVVQDVADLWAMERAGFYHGQYHVLGGVLSALDGISPEDLNIETLLSRIRNNMITEVILALPATIDGSITSNYLVSRLKEFDIKITTLAQGIPIGAELDYMDDGTLQLALNSSKEI